MTLIQKILSSPEFVNNDQNHDRGICYNKLGIDYIYVPIPKNASTYISRHLQRKGWVQQNYFKNPYLDNKKPFVVLRDPFERWLSGFSEYIARLIDRDYNDFEFLRDKNLYDRVVYDEHTQSQSFYIDWLDLNKTYFLYMDTSFTENLDFFLNSNVGSNMNFDKGQFVNDSNDRKHRHSVRTELNTVLKMYPEIEKNIKNFYKNDYDLIDQLRMSNKLIQTGQS